jgi:hypothetical protein
MRGGQYRRHQTEGGTFKTVPPPTSDPMLPSTGQMPEIQFRNSEAITIFDCLVSAFVEDYMVRKALLDLVYDSYLNWTMTGMLVS